MNSLYLKVLKVDSSEAVINKFYDTLIDTNTRKNRHYVPLSFYVMNLFLKNGFVLKEDIIKVMLFKVPLATSSCMGIITILLGLPAFLYFA